MADPAPGAHRRTIRHAQGRRPKVTIPKRDPHQSEIPRQATEAQAPAAGPRPEPRRLSSGAESGRTCTTTVFDVADVTVAVGAAVAPVTAATAAPDGTPAA